MNKDELIVKICKKVIVVFGVLAVFNFILLINKKSYALFTKTITSDETVVHIETGDSLPIKPGPAIDIVKGTIDKLGGVIGVKADNTKTTNKGDEVREYRYSGNDGIKNYIYFNCSNGTTYETASSNCEKWRIIGVFKDESGKEHLKIVRNEVLSRELFPVDYKIEGTTYKIQYIGSGDYAYWNNKVSGTNNNDWATAGLQYWLNTTQDETAEASNKGYLSYLKGDTLSMIEETKYYLGTVTHSSNYIIDTPKEAYTNERAVSGCEGGVGPATNTGTNLTFESTPNCRVWANNKAIWEGKVALMYPSDYGFSVSSENDNWEKQLKDFSSIKSSSWMNSMLSNGGWLLSPGSNDSRGVADWHTVGYVDNNNADNVVCVRPSVNLISEIKIIQGDGTSGSPYFLEL